MARSLNRVQLIGNLTRDPELRYTPNGTAVCSFGLATNRNWKTDTGERHEEAEFHNIVAWNKLAELCSQFLVKGRKVYVEGRLSTRSWTAQDGTQKNRTEIVISDMILLDSRRSEGESRGEPSDSGSDISEPSNDFSSEGSMESKEEDTEKSKKSGGKQKGSKGTSSKNEADEGDVEPSDIPF